MALNYDPENGFYLAFSGGKDSQVLYHLARMAGVKFKAHMNLTSVDPPDVIRFVKSAYPDVELIKPSMSMYNMALKTHILPTRSLRWCCAKFKETSGAGKVTLIGIRKAESARRNKRNEIETGDRKFSGNFDQFSEHRETMITCVNGKDKILISPILNWTDKDVWEFIHRYKTGYCKLYDEGYKRIGCILCPMANRKQKIKDIQRFPHVKRKWVQVIQKLIDAGYINHNFTDAEFGFNWWISDKSFDQYYADEVLQQKIQF
ncbi:phosphoadenosine phosphosulfate reductase family protein [Parabacteroides goldsteinii]|uniref:phosphoadenosine phosphosulfate reductase family protein n=1 Tax=Parabacteroides goldsteinii TaxID=328812 RepID=UPI0032C15121